MKCVCAPMCLIISYLSQRESSFLIATSTDLILDLPFHKLNRFLALSVMYCIIFDLWNNLGFSKRFARKPDILSSSVFVRFDNSTCHKFITNHYTIFIFLYPFVSQAFDAISFPKPIYIFHCIRYLPNYLYYILLCFLYSDAVVVSR